MLLACLLPLVTAAAAAAGFPSVIPAVHSFEPSASEQPFKLPTSRPLLIAVDAAFAASTDSDSTALTLIPPTLLAFAHTFSADLQQLFPGTSAQVQIQVSSASARNADVFLTLLSPSQRANVTLHDGTRTPEDYRLEIAPAAVAVRGSGARGAFWGTRTLLQALLLGGGVLPAGVVSDAPDWGTRGFMLDVGRQWYPIGFLTELCAYASWFKISEFHTHLSDNVELRDPKTTYARFRLRPSDPALAGLTPHLNETYSREEFEDFQASCAARGVTVIPEIESPGHALVITQWKPELALSTDPTLLNISFPDTIPTVKSIWQEFLPWLHSKQVSIGADEYDADLADDYNDFVNTMSNFIWQQSKKTIRIWGTNEPSNTTSVSKNITIQHWEFFEDDPFELIRAGYRVINSDDAFQYIVLKYSDGYPQKLNQTRLWDGANTVTGGIWDPHVFDRGNSSNNPTPENPLLAGSIMAAWNDPGPNATTYLEAFYSIKAGLPVIAAANWQAASRPNHLTQAQYLASFPRLEAAAPAQNLDRRIKSAHAVVVEYNLTSTSKRPGAKVKDGSGNKYDGTWVNGSVKTPLGSKGHNYTFLIEVGTHNVSGPLLTGPDDSFGFTPSGNGSTLAFTSSNTLYSLSNYTLPASTSTALSSREIIVTGTEGGTSAFVDGQHAGDFVIAIDGNSAILAPMAFVAPVQQIAGTVARFVLWDGVQDISSISRSSNSSLSMDN
ncbi:glycoside hydrolase [Dentipellis sp. KUC8613]|nr:glycoside hydrolase [Dentipellis sp. KUC8613]